MDHEALEAELQRVEARARARRKRFEAAHQLELVQTPSRRNQLKVIAILTLFSAGVPVLYLVQLLSTKPALSKSAQGPDGSFHAVTGPEKGTSGGSGWAAKKNPA